MSELQKFKSNLPAKPEQFISEFTPHKCLAKFSKVTTPALCLSSGTPTLASIRKSYSDDFIQAYIELWLDNLNDFINAGQKMSPAQMQETAILLYQEYFYFTIADINLVFRKIKMGEFGKLYSTIDGMKIISWFELYSQERMNMAADNEMNHHAGFKEDVERSNDPEAEQIKNMRTRGFELLHKAKK